MNIYFVTLRGWDSKDTGIGPDTPPSFHLIKMDKDLKVMPELLSDEYKEITNMILCQIREFLKGKAFDKLVEKYNLGDLTDMDKIKANLPIMYKPYANDLYLLRELLVPLMNPDLYFRWSAKKLHNCEGCAYEYCQGLLDTVYTGFDNKCICEKDQPIQCLKCEHVIFKSQNTFYHQDREALLVEELYNTKVVHRTHVV